MRIFFLFAVLCPYAFGEADLSKAPPNFTYETAQAVFVDFKRVELSLDFDYAKNKAFGRARIEFFAEHEGFPIFDIVPTPSALNLNQTVIATDLLKTHTPRGNATRFRILTTKVLANSNNVLELSYPLTNDVTYHRDAVRIGFFMDDLAEGGREFFERYGPASFENDQYPMSMKVSVSGTDKPHVIYSNGSVKEVDTTHWQVDFPAHFTTSSYYFHLTEKNRFAEESFVFDGIEKDFPVVIYASDADQVADAKPIVERVLGELEETYGAFAHRRLIVYVTDGDSGMEYAGATMTGISAIEHELTHSWFARGVMPANGNAGWIDEAIASWRDQGYFRRQSNPNPFPVNLASYSPYKRETTELAYRAGRRLIEHLDYVLRDQQFEGQNGMRAILRQLFQSRGLTTLTTEMFQSFVEKAGGKNLDKIFGRHVFGKSFYNEKAQEEADQLSGDDLGIHKRYTKEELIQYR